MLAEAPYHRMCTMTEGRSESETAGLSRTASRTRAPIRRAHQTHLDWPVEVRALHDGYEALPSPTRKCAANSLHVRAPICVSAARSPN